MNCGFLNVRCEDVSCDLCKEIATQSYNKALDDLWKLATSKFDEVMDFQDLAECIKELKEH